MVRKKVSVEEVLTRAVRSAGGRPVSELLPQGSDVPKNADFVFRIAGYQATYLLL
ncbi:MAG: hypothetical protein ACLQDV_25245 [Candidatus Binataceae bacterium]